MIVAAVAFPVGAWAVTSSNVFVTDATSGAHATVSSAGALSVSGSVTANNASAKNLYQNLGDPGAGFFVPVATPPAGKALVITSLNVDTSSGAGTGYVQLTISATDATCSIFATLLGFVHLPTDGMTSIPIPSGLVIPAKRALCAADIGATTTTMAFGYLVAASAAPPGESVRSKVVSPLVAPSHKP